MLIIDKTRRKSDPVPITPSLPYRVETHRYGPGEGVARLTKIRPNGLAELLAPDEIAVWTRARWFEDEQVRRAAGPVAAEHDSANPPPLPYEVVPLRYGVGEGVTIPTKTRPGDYSDEGLTPDEVAVWAYLKRLEQELGKIASPPLATSNTVLETTHEDVTFNSNNTSEREPPVAPLVSNAVEPAPEEVLEGASNVIAPEPIVPTNAVLVEEVATPRYHWLTTGSPRPTSAVPGEEVVAPVVSNTNTGLTKREQAERALLESPSDNNCVIAERLGVSDELVRKVRKELEGAGRLQPLTVLNKRDGTSCALTGDALGGEPANG